MKKITAFFRKELEDYSVLLRNIPAMVLTLFVVSVIAMNLLANKELFSISWVALDCGFALSWVAFLTMDCVCKRFGGKAATKISILAIGINLLTFAIFKLLSFTPGKWGAYYDTGLNEVNDALNQTIGGSTWIVLGSALAMLISSIVNSIVNMSISRVLKKNTYREFAIRSFSSTAIAQFVDNLTFALVVSVPLFGWTMKQVLVCSVVAAVFELLMEVFFSGFGYRMTKKWEKENVGKDYIDFVKSQKTSQTNTDAE